MEYGIVLLWLAVYLLLMGVGLPLAAVLFPRFGDRGAGVALPLALAVVWVFAYLVGHVSLAAGFWGGLVVLVALSLLAVYRGVEIDRRRYAETAAVFAVAFGFLVAIRAVDAGVHPYGGEKFLDFGLMMSILRSTALPPEDMWFAGEPVQYYYGGHLLAAFLTRLTGTTPQYAYNLALSGFYAMLVTAAYGIAGAIASSRQMSRVKAGALGAFFVGFAGNLTTAGRFFLWLLPESLSAFVVGMTPVDLKYLSTGPANFSYWSASRVIVDHTGTGRVTTINEFPLFAWLNGDMHAHMMNTAFLLLAVAVLFSYYRTPTEDRLLRRLLVFGVLPPVAGMNAVVSTWSYPTVGGLAVLTLALAPTSPTTLLPATVAERLQSEDPWRREGARYVTALIGAGVVLALGALWTLPFWLGTASGREVALFPPRSSMSELLAVHGGFVLVFGVYLGRHAVPRIERQHLDEVVVMLGLGVMIAWLGADAAVVGLVGPLILVGWILLRTQDVLPDGMTATTRQNATEAVADGGLTTRPDAPGPIESVTDRLRDVVGYETLLIVAGAGLVLIVEFAFVKEQAGPGRMNTVFKTYMDIWVLWAVAAGVAAVRLIENRSLSLALTSRRWRSLSRAGVVAIVLATSLYGAFALSEHFQVLLTLPVVGDQVYAYHLWLVAATFAAATALYRGLDITLPLLAPSLTDSDWHREVRVVTTLVLVTATVFAGFTVLNYEPGAAYRTHPEDPTLNGFNYVGQEHPNEAEAIAWLNTLEGQPNMVSAPGRPSGTVGGMYRWTNAPSSLTGVPTLAGWRHEVGYRGGETYRERVSHVDAIFTGDPDVQRKYLRQHNVEYVYVGPRERGYYSGITVDDLEAVTPVKTFGEGNRRVVVYRVDQQALSSN